MGLAVALAFDVWETGAIVSTLIINAGQTKALAPNTGIVEFNTGASGGAATMIAPSFAGQRWVFDWLTGTAIPTITAPPGLLMQDYANPSTFVSSTSLSTPVRIPWRWSTMGRRLIRVS